MGTNMILIIMVQMELYPNDYHKYVWELNPNNVSIGYIEYVSYWLHNQIV